MQTSVAILIQVLFLNLLCVLMEQIGSRTEVNGQTIHTNHQLEQLSSSIGSKMEKLTTLELCRNVRTELFIQLRATLEIVAEPKLIVLDLHQYMVMVFLHIKKMAARVSSHQVHLVIPI